jgi:predicted NBD/HSP70 family sugar kinase
VERVYFGIEIGGTKLQIAAGAGAGVITRRERLNIDPQKVHQESATKLSILPGFWISSNRRLLV